MPSKKVSVLAQAVKDRVTRKPTAKKTATANKPAVEEPVIKKTAAKKTATKKTTDDDSDAITADNNPAVAPKRAVKSAGKAPTRRTNASKKRKASDDDEQENKAPVAKKTKTTKKNVATAPKKSKSPVNKTAAANKKKAAAKKTTADRVAAANADLLAKTMVDIVANAKAAAGNKRKASDDEDDDEKEHDAPAAKKANTTTKKNFATARAKKAKPPVAAKKTTAKKTAASRAATAEADVINRAMDGAASKAASRKRKVTADDESSDEAGDDGDAPNAKRVKTSKARSVADEAAPEQASPNKAAPKKRAAAPKEAPNPALKTKIGDKINSAPTQLLDVFVCGEGSAGELGLGSRRLGGKMPIDVKRPRFNPYLSGEDPGVVQFACGGMHGIALTRDNRVLTWGVNDNGALGRNTKWAGGLRPASPQRGDQEENTNANEDENEAEANNVEHNEGDSGLNPLESTPAEIDVTNVAPGTKFVHVAASDSASFALTEDGRVYSWGTFRATEGILGFSKDVHEQFTPVLLPEPKKVVAIATGSNHVLTLDQKGKVQTWGTYQQSQLGRRIVDRDARASALRPGGLPFKRGVQIAKVAAGSYHSFALTTDGEVYAWGLNNFAQLGVPDGAGVDGATVLQPTLVESLEPHRVVDVAGGEHHSVVLTDDGHVLVWGRMDIHQCGFARDVCDRANSLFDANDLPRVLVAPTAHDATLPGPCAAVAVGTGTSLVVTRDGQAFAWGFNANYQCGLGETDGEVYPPKAIDNSAVRDRKIIAVGCGGQFSMLASRHGEEEDEDEL